MASPSALVYAWLPGSPLAACLNAVAGETCPSQWAQDNDQVPGLLHFKDSSHFLIIAQSVVLEASLREQLQQRQRAQSREMQCHPHFLRKLLPPTTASPLELYLATDSASQHRKKSDGCLLHLFELIVFSINWTSCHALSVFIQNVLMNLIHSFNFPEKKKIPFLNLLNTDLDFFFLLVIYCASRDMLDCLVILTLIYQNELPVRMWLQRNGSALSADNFHYFDVPQSGTLLDAH